ncbi:MAG: T9SS type A sorting domain-containing protein [Flavobacteriales bacterium]|nr:T9SS type A sorting domain-containing protein [Flavobacteriales bacterium]
MSIRYNGTNGRMNIEVLDMTGRLVFNDRLAATGGTTIQLALAGKLAAGSYMLRLSTDAQTHDQHIVIR